MAAEFVETFVRDAFELLDTLRTLDSVELESEKFRAMARALHSLKSGASFLAWDELETEAHRLENLLVEPGGAVVDWPEAADRLHRIVRVQMEVSREENRRRKTVGRAVRFTDHERDVLIESRLRNEGFYRLTCTIDTSEPLPYSRAYLLASRIETGMTLVKTEPPMNESDAVFHRPTFWFTTEKAESEIFKVTNIDLVDVVELIQLSYDDLLDRGEVSVSAVEAPVSEDATLLVDRSRYTDTIAVAEELAWRLERRPGTPESDLSAELQRSLESLAFRPLEPLLENLAAAVGRLAERRGSSARFVWSVASGGLDAATLETVGEVIKQLIRNSLRHGIEGPDERRASGKDETGLLSLSVDRSGRTYRFEYEDDGRGIDEDAVLAKARREGVEEGSDLIDILCRPGFSTVDEADADGGRGLGLDTVRHMLRREFGSDLELKNRPGAGVVVRWSLPEKHMRRPYLVFFVDGRKWAVPVGCVHRRGVVDASRVDAAGQGYRLGDGVLPIVGPEGLRPPGPIPPYFLEIRHRGRRAALFVDDLVSEEPWGRDELCPADPIGTWGRALADAKSGIPIISPALVYAAEETTAASQSS